MRTKTSHSLLKSLALLLIVTTSLGFCEATQTPVTTRAQDAESTPAQPRLVVQLGHTLPVLSAAFSPDSEYVLTGSGDTTARLWEADTGREVRRFEGHSLGVISVFSPDGKYVLTGSWDKTARLWETATGKDLLTFKGHSDQITSVAFSPDGKHVLTGSRDKTARLWNGETGRMVRIFETPSGVIRSVAFSPSGEHLLTGSEDGVARLWEADTGKEARRFEGHSGWVSSVAFSPEGECVLTWDLRTQTAHLWEAATATRLRKFDGGPGLGEQAVFSPNAKYVLTGGDKGASVWITATGEKVRNFSWSPWPGVKLVGFSPDEKYVLTVGSGWVSRVRLWEAETGREAGTLEGHSDWVTSVAVSPDGRYMVIGSQDKTARMWETNTGREMRRFKGHSDSVSAVAFSPDGKKLLTGSRDKTARLWEAETGSELYKLEHTDWVESVAFSPDGKSVLTGSHDKAARLWDAETGLHLRRFEPHSIGVSSLAFSPDGRYVLTNDVTAQLWEAATAISVRKFHSHVHSVAFSPDGVYAVSGSSDKTARLWEVESGRQVQSFEGHSLTVLSVAFSPDGKHILTGSVDGTARLWEVKTGKQTRTFEGHAGAVDAVAFSLDGKSVLTVGRDFTTRVWDPASGRELCSLVSFRDGTWAVIDSEGRYDASNAGDVRGLHWVVYNESIALTQLKNRYYEPGLLAKILKNEPLRNVAAFKEVKLYPDVSYQAPAPGTTNLKINLTNRGGGIGKVAVLVNDKEVTADARGLRVKSQAGTADIVVDLSAAAIKPGQENEIRVLVYNAAGYLSSRGPVVKWTAPGEAVKAPPELYAVVAGVSAYKAESIDLLYAAKDAEDMAKALRLGAKSLFGADKVHITVLSTSGNAGTIRPTRDNLKKAFEQAGRSRPEDVLVVYLAGHGTAVRLSGDDDVYCYLTEDFRGDDLADEAIRAEQSVTSDDLAEWIKDIPALKQIMMLDTCAAGAASAKLKLVDSRLPASDQVRALDRLKDRTGFHVLMGAAADKASYETSQYSQGLLTYALLEGMKYGAVRNEIVEVSNLFQYARDRVPVLARNIGIGGVQQPQIMAPKADSFPVVRMTSKDAEEIHLAKAKPLVLRPRLINPSDVDDDELEKAVRLALREESEPVTRGAGRREPRLVYLDDGELPSAVRPSGTFTVDGDRVQVNLSLRRAEQRVTLEVEGVKSDLPALSAKIVALIAERMKAFQ